MLNGLNNSFNNGNIGFQGRNNGVSSADSGNNNEVLKINTNSTYAVPCKVKTFGFQDLL